MICFRCNTYLYQKKVSGVPIRECPGCKGIWVSSENLENLEDTFNISLDAMTEKNTITGHACKHCSGNIREVTVSTDGGSVDLDECTNCKGVWFDYGELEKTKELFEAVNRVFTKQRIKKLRQKTVWKEKLSKVYDEGQPVAKQPTLTRNAFIAKVYRLFMLSLLTGALGSGAGVFFGLGYTHFWGLFILELAVLIWAMCVRKNQNWNMLALFSFATISGFTTSPLLNLAITKGQGALIPIAIGLTALLFGALTWYVHKTKKDFSFLGGFLTSSLFVMVVAGITGLFVPGLINILIYCSLGVVLFSGFVLYDTSRVILKYDLDEYVSATLDLYLDFLNIFVDILGILMETSAVSDFFPDIGDLF